MADFKAGEQIVSEWWPESVTVTESTDQLNITSTSYTAGSPECGVTFVAPRTGRVGIALSAEMRNQDTGGNRVLVAPEVYLGTSSAGTLVLAPTVARGVSTTGDTTASEFMNHGNFSMLDGLTAGATYFVRVMHQVTGGTTNDIGERRLVVIPLG